MGKVILWLISISSLTIVIGTISFPISSELVYDETTEVLNSLYSLIISNPSLAAISSSVTVILGVIVGIWKHYNKQREESKTNIVDKTNHLTDRALAKAVRDQLINEQIFLENTQQRAREELIKVRTKYIEADREYTEAQRKYSECKYNYELKKKEFDDREIELLKVDSEIEKASKLIDKLTTDIHRDKVV